MITLTVGSRVGMGDKPGGKPGLSSGKEIGGVAQNASAPDGGNDDAGNGSIRVEIPDREVYDQSVAATEQNKASVVSHNKISSANSSTMQGQLDLGATSQQENK